VSLIAQTPGIPAARNGHYTPGNDIPAIRNTRYLSAAAHLRQSMLPNEIDDPATGTSRAPRRVGRAYAIQVLFRHGSRIPMLGVDVGKVKKSCWVALVQTTVRDMAALGALAVGLIIEPWGMIITLGIVVAAVMLTRRSRFFLVLIFLGVVCVALALVNGNRNERISLGTPLACLVLCLLAYLADAWLSMLYVRSIWRRSARQEKALAALRSSPVEGAPPADKARSANRKLILRIPAQWPYAGRLGDGRNGTHRGTGDRNGRKGNGGNGNGAHDRDVDSSGGGRAMPAKGDPVRVYYASNKIVGAGTSLQSLPLTVPVDKPLDASSDIGAFSSSELMTELSDHLLSQGAADAEVHGWAYQPLSPDGAGHSPHEPGHFTYGLPYLDVTEVVATPAPDTDRWLGTPFTVTRLDYRSPVNDDMHGLADRSASVHRERHYLRVMTTSWDGQLTATVFVNATLQGHFLRMIMRPYVLAPTGIELGVADDLIKWNPFFLACLAVYVTTRQFRAAAAKFKRSDSKEGKKSRPKLRRPHLYSIREDYARTYVSNMQQVEDSDRTIYVLEEKIFRVTMDFLKRRNVDVTEFEKQMQNIIYNNTVSGNITSGTFNNSQIANVSGRSNTANNIKNTTTDGKI
jgi:hypothetical protein